MPVSLCNIFSGVTISSLVIFWNTCGFLKHVWLLVPSPWLHDCRSYEGFINHQCEVNVDRGGLVQCGVELPAAVVIFTQCSVYIMPSVLELRV